MKLVRKELAQLPVEPCPKCELKKDTQCIVTAKSVRFQDGELLVVTYYNAATRVPHCRVYLTQIDYISFLCDKQEWTNKGVEKLPLPNGNGGLTQDWYTVNANAKGLKAAQDFTKIRWYSSIAGVVERQEQQIRSNRSDAARERREARENVQLCEAMATLPPLPEDVERFVLEGPLKHSAYLFYHSVKHRNPLAGVPENSYMGYCTCCKAEHELDFIPQHREHCHCPGCGRVVQARARGISRTKLVDWCNIVVQGVGGGAAYLRFFTAVRDYTGEPEHVQTRFYEQEIFRFADDKSLHIARYESGPYGNRYISNTWSVKRTKQENTKDCTRYPAPAEVWRGTCLEHSQLALYMAAQAEQRLQAGITDYLYTYLQRPGVEHLLQEGLFRFVRELMWGESANGIVDWTKTRPRAMLGVPQGELARIAALGWGVKELAVYKRVKPLGLAVGDEDAEQLIELMAERYTVTETVCAQLGFERIVRYLRYQRRRRYGNQTRYKDIWGQWTDYRRDAARLGHDMALPENLFPPDLPGAHDRAAAEMLEHMEREEQKRTQWEAAAWKRQYKALQPLCWEADGLIIRPVRSQKELTEEGDKLSHCVAGYGSRVRAGETHILFIRKAEEPDTPYFTLNLSPEGRLIQCHGYKNDAKYQGGVRPEFIKEFEKKWLKAKVGPWLKAKQRQEREKAKKKKQQGAA